jgi:hypothetical protein
VCECEEELVSNRDDDMLSKHFCFSINTYLSDICTSHPQICN